MKIVHDDGRNLRLRGSILEWPWLLVLAVLVGGGSAILVPIIVDAVQRAKWLTLAGPGVGMLLITTLGVVGVGLALQCEALEFDNAVGAGVYRKWFRILGLEKRTQFRLEHVHSVSVEFAWESPGGGRGFPVRVCKARLRLDKPRRVFQMDEVRDTSHKRIQALADRVAAFLRVPVEQVGSPDDQEPPARPGRRRRRSTRT